MKYTFISTDGSKCDIVTVSKDLLKNATMSAEVFDDLVISFTKENISMTEAYYKAEEVHEEYFGRPRYTDHGVYKSSYSHRHNRKK
jgi:ABC-type xylose transport system substrate-binding protein